MKSILLSIRPEWVAKILNGEKTIEIRKKFPKDFVGWVYIYCTKGKDILTFEYASVDNINIVDYPCGYTVVKKLRNDIYIFHDGSLNGKVVARFWCEDIEYCEDTSILNDEDYDLEQCCLTAKELQSYSKSIYAIHISKLEVFDRPKELKEFNSANGFITCDKCLWKNDNGLCSCQHCNSLYKAPQSWCYVEDELK